MGGDITAKYQNKNQVGRKFQQILKSTGQLKLLCGGVSGEIPFDGSKG